MTAAAMALALWLAVCALTWRCTVYVTDPRSKTLVEREWRAEWYDWRGDCFAGKGVAE